MIRELQITPEQAETLRDLQANALAAQDRFNVAFTMVVRGHGITQASTPLLEGTTLTVTVPDAAS